MNESVGQAFQGGCPCTPFLSREGTNVARLIANELDAAKFGPTASAVRRHIVPTQAWTCYLDVRMASLCEIGQQCFLVDSQLHRNKGRDTCTLATFLYHCGTRMQALEGEHSSDVYAILNPTVVVSARLNANTSRASDHPTEYAGDVPAYCGPSLSCYQVRLRRDHRQTTSRSNTINGPSCRYGRFKCIC